MGVYVKGIGIPGSCIQCKLWYLIPLADTYEDICRVTGHRVNPYHRADDCPLIEVSEPHGRLIDADKMRESIRKQTAFLRLLGGKFAEIAETLEKGFLQEIDNAPIIIPASNELPKISGQMKGEQNEH